MELYTDTCYYISNRGLFGARTITEQQALARGADQARIDSINSTPGLTSVVYKESSLSVDGLRNYDAYSGSRAYASSNPAKGTVAINVTIPQHSGQWAIKVTDALAYEKGYVLSLGLGYQRIVVTDVEAGNTLVSLFALQPDGRCTTHFQEAYALVRKNGTAEINNMAFVGDKNSFGRYRIGHLGIGQNSQSILENLPLQAGRDAMVRVMVYDTFGQGMHTYQTFPVQVSWSLGGQTHTAEFYSHISGRHARSGRLNGATGTDTLGYVIPAVYIQPGLHISAKLLDPDTYQVLRQVGPISVDVVSPRTIKLTCHEVRSPWGSGVPIARDTNGWDHRIMPFTRDAFPYATIIYNNGGTTFMPIIGSGAHNHVMVLAVMGGLPTDRPTDSLGNDNYYRLKVGVMNDRYAGGIGGMCWYWRPGISLAAEHGVPYQKVAYTLAHEMGHAFGLEHAPSRGASSYLLGFHLNRVDDNYPYSGGGMAGGWGYADFLYSDYGTAAHAKHFLSEDAHTFDNNFQAHWDVMAYTDGYNRTYKTNRFSDFNQRKMLNALELNQVNPPSNFQAPDDPISDFPVLPGTSIKIFGPEQARAAEEAWHREFGVRSIYAVDPAQIASTPLDFDPSTITVTGSGGIIMPRNRPANTSIPVEFAHLVEAGEFDTGDDDDGGGNSDEPPFMIVTRLPRLLGVNVNQ
jgi:hypothetical protein